MNIYGAITAVMKDCGFIGKDSVNEVQRYKYRGIDAVMNALNPAFVKNHVFCVPEVLEQTREERVNTKGTTLIYSIVTVKYTFFADDGSSVSAVVVGEGMDSGDKATNKAMSAAYKYACFQIFCIPTEEMHDSEEDSPEVAPRNAPGGPQTAPNASGDNFITPRQKTAIEAELNRTGVSRKNLLASYGKESLDDLTKWQASDAIKRLKATKDKP